MSYTRLGGGELSALELNTLSGNVVDDSNGVINTSVAMAALVDTLFSEGSDLVNFLSDLIPSEFLGEGRYSYGPVRAHSIPTALDGNAWNPKVINLGNLSKKDFAKTGSGILLAMGVSYLVKNFGFNSAAGAAVAVAGGLSSKAHRAKVLAALEQNAPKAAVAPVVANSAKSEVALKMLISGMAKNDASELMKGLRILQD